MLEEVFFGKLVLPGELFRIFLALLGTGIAAYYDVFNRKNVPDMFLYGFLAFAFLFNLIFFQDSLFWFSLVLTIFVSGIGYIFYRLGQLGGADVFVLASIILLLPIHPSFSALPFNFPFVFSLLIFSGVLFSIYIMLYFSRKLYQAEAKPNWLYLLMLLPYFVFAYVYVNSFLFSPVYFIFISVLLFAAIFFMLFKDAIHTILAEELPVSQLQPEDVVAIDLMNKDLVSRYKIPRVINKEIIENLKKAKINEIWVYTRLPPFLPFLFLGAILALLFARTLIII